jgi:transcriptional regulator with XRE-family HTH domain
MDFAVYNLDLVCYNLPTGGIYMYKIGGRIKMFREERGFSQKEFAEAIGQSNTTVSNWERGLTRPDVDMLVKICEVLAVAADDILDIQITSGNITEHEKKVVLAYRKKAKFQEAIDTLLGLGNDA